MVVLPQQALDALLWKRGDHVIIEMQSEQALRITKFNPVQMSDRIRLAMEPEPKIHA